MHENNPTPKYVPCAGCKGPILGTEPCYVAVVGYDEDGEMQISAWCLDCGPNVIDEEGHRPRYVDPAKLRRMERQ
jgi:hypothetical protein